MKILFICRANSGRSQIGKAFFNKLSKKHHAVSAGVSVGDREGEPVAEMVIKCMKEQGYDLSQETKKQLIPDMVKEADKIIVAMEECERDDLPEYLKNSSKIIYWPVKDGKGQSYEFHLKMRDQLKGLVEELIQEIE